MRDFLFELNNAIRAPKFAALAAEAVKGSTGTLTARSYAYKMAEQEVEGMLRLGETWFKIKSAEGSLRNGMRTTRSSSSQNTRQ